jgi:hypothetical protein
MNFKIFYFFDKGNWYDEDDREGVILFFPDKFIYLYT